VDIAEWLPDDDFPIGPQGRKPKSIVRCPSWPPYPFLIGDHRYLFKQPTGPKAQQVWSEILAYELARTVGVPVPPAFAAINSRDGTFGVLIEFFYGYQHEMPARFFHAVEVFQGTGRTPDERVGSLRDNIDLCRVMQITNRLAWWGRTVSFDAIIANTDRHSENWGFIRRQADTPERGTYEMAPVFDNGTSLGFVVRDEDLPKYRTGTPKFENFLKRGYHHFGWTSSDNLRQHVALCGHFAALREGARESMRSVIQLPDRRIEDIARWCAEFRFPVVFTEERADFVVAQIKARRDRLADVIGA